MYSSLQNIMLTKVTALFNQCVKGFRKSIYWVHCDSSKYEMSAWR